MSVRWVGKNGRQLRRTTAWTGRVVRVLLGARVRGEGS